MTDQTHPSSGMMSDEDLAQLRIDMAAAFQLTVAFGWHESVGNHFSAAVSSDGKSFVMNPKWVHFSDVTPDNLLLLNADDPDTMTRPDAPDASAWCIHGSVHRMLPKARVLLHLHPPYATALAGLKDPRMYPIDQNTARFYHMAIDDQFGGMADDEAEGIRIAEAFGDASVLLLRNHGVAVTANTVAEAFELMYFFERAAKTLMLAYASGQPLDIMSDAIAESTARSWDDYAGASFKHFEFLKRSIGM
jgi:ribulose-5-phosphate 4-epimerase/fuculose-1-phosphate aldolase